jgi:hypothetical protein
MAEGREFVIPPGDWRSALVLIATFGLLTTQE